MLKENNIQVQLFNQFKRQNELNFLSWRPINDGAQLVYVERLASDLQVNKALAGAGWGLALLGK